MLRPARFCQIHPNKFEFTHQNMLDTKDKWNIC